MSAPVSERPIASGLTDRGRRIAGWIILVCESGGVFIWLLLAVGNLYGVPWIEARELGLDELFLVAVIVVLAVSFTKRWGLARSAVAGFALFLALCAAAAGELTVRYVYRDVYSSGRVGDYFGWHAKGPKIEFNHLGYRDREIPPKAPGEYRIAVIGDSFTWGQGVPEFARFSNRIQDALGAPAYQVFNFGMPGANMPQHLERLPQVLTFHPDFVLLQLYFNDFEMRDMIRPQPYPLLPPELDRVFERSSATYSLLNTQWSRLQELLGIVESQPAWEARYLRDPNSPDSIQGFGMLNSFIDQAQQANVGVGIVFFPFPDRLGHNGADYPYHFLHDRVTKTCAAKQIPCLDLLAAFSSYKNPHTMWVNPFDAHPNAMANERAAYEIMARFGRIWQERQRGAAGK